MNSPVTVGASGYAPGPKIVKKMKSLKKSEKSLYINHNSEWESYLLTGVKDIVEDLSFKKIN